MVSTSTTVGALGFARGFVALAACICRGAMPVGFCRQSFVGVVFLAGSAFESAANNVQDWRLRIHTSNGNAITSSCLGCRGHKSWRFIGMGQRAAVFQAGVQYVG